METGRTPMYEDDVDGNVSKTLDRGEARALRLAAQADELIVHLVALDRAGFHDLGPTRDHVEELLGQLHRASLACQDRGQIGFGELLHSLAKVLRGMLRMHAVRPDPEAWARFEEDMIARQRPVEQVIQARQDR